MTAIAPAVPADAAGVPTRAGLPGRARALAAQWPVVPVNVVGDPAVAAVGNGLLSGKPFDV